MATGENEHIPVSPTGEVPAFGGNRLHAYWRMPYIEAPRKSDAHGRENPFLRIPRTSDPKKEGLLFVGRHNFIVMNRFPYNAGHLLVLPLREVGDLEDLNEDEQHEHFDFILLAKRILRDAVSPDGFNIGYNLGSAAGAGIPRHLHCHIVPRWSGDTNFMPVIGDTRVLPQSMELMWERLRATAESLAAESAKTKQ